MTSDFFAVVNYLICSFVCCRMEFVDIWLCCRSQERLRVKEGDATWSMNARDTTSM